MRGDRPRNLFPSKSLGCFGDGGMVTTNDPALAEHMSWLRNHDMNPKYYHQFSVGATWR
jgi:dTDP-4-amino-4,6-dideoxygalactose transaminase